MKASPGYLTSKLALNVISFDVRALALSVAHPRSPEASTGCRPLARMVRDLEAFEESRRPGPAFMVYVICCAAIPSSSRTWRGDRERAVVGVTHASAPRRLLLHRQSSTCRQLNFSPLPRT